MPRDLHNNLKIIRNISPVAIGTTGTGKTGKIVDRRGYDSVEFEISYGSITATNAAFTVRAFEGDTTGSMTSIADADLIGTEAAATPGTGARTSGTTMNVTKRLGYRGIKRYVNCQVFSTVTAAPPIAVNVLLGDPTQAPQAT